MIDLEKFITLMDEMGIRFITGVPDSLLNDFCSRIENNWPKELHVIAANEGNAVALATGYHLATNTIPMVYMQNSGLGNTINPLLSLASKGVFSIPMILLIGWRGEPGTKDHVQHQQQGELTPVFMEAMGIPVNVIEDDISNAAQALVWAVETSKSSSSPVALLVRKGVMEEGKKIDYLGCDINYLTREDAIKAVVDSSPRDTIFLATTGRATRELFKLREEIGEAHKYDFLNVGAMGHTSSIAAGIALAKGKRQVVCLDGDSAAIMHLGALTTIGGICPRNLIHVILNNGAHESVGGQPSVGKKINFTLIAESVGYQTIGKAVKSKDSINSAIKFLLDNGPGFIDIHIQKGLRENLPPLKISLLDNKNSLMKELSGY